MEFLNAVIEFGLYGVIPEEESDVWLYGFEQTITSIGCAKDRYSQAIENGKKGGRKKTIDDSKVIELKEQGYTHKKIAEIIGCSESSVDKIVRKSGKTVKTVNTGKNLNENVNVNVNVNVNDNVCSSLKGAELGETPKPPASRIEDFKNSWGM